MSLSDEERARRSERARELVAQGKIGGARYGKLGGRPRKVTLTEIVAEKVRARADEVAAAIIENLDPTKPANVRLQAAKQALEVEASDNSRRQHEEKDFERMSDPALAKLVAGMLNGLKGAGALEQLFADVDVLAEEITDVELVDDDESPNGKAA